MIIAAIVLRLNEANELLVKFQPISSFEVFASDGKNIPRRIYSNRRCYCISTCFRIDLISV